MPTSRTVVILHGAVAADARPDERDVLTQVEAVTAALVSLGYKAVAVPLDLNLARAKEWLQSLCPWVVFNLVESIAANDRLALLGPCLLDSLGIPYTGTPTNGLALTSDKGLTKRWLLQHSLPTPAVPGERAESGSWIIKSLWEHASFGLDDSSVIGQPNELPAALALRRARYGGEWFAERYVEGRELNVGLLAEPQGVQVLPIAEMLFSNYPPHKPHIVDYRAKWEPGSFEDQNTVRCFEQRPEDYELRAELRDRAVRCWEVFGLRGYARVDFRVDRDGKPWVLEVNANPCLSPDAGYAAALAEAGISFAQALARIIEDARREDRRREDRAKDRHRSQALPRRKSFMQAERSGSRAELLYTRSEALRLRSKPCAEDICRVETLIRATDFFSEEEVSMALELLSECLAKAAASGYQFLFAETLSELAGFACFGRIPCTQASYDLYWLVVAPALQGHGIGKALLTAAEAMIATEGGRRVYIDTSGRAKYQSTHRFYEGAGYREIALFEDFYAPSDPKVVYLKILGRP